MKIAVIADAHANLPALNAVLKAIRTEACDSIFHLGDAIAIGPYPAECIDLLQSTPNLKCVLGNHDLYFVNGLSNPLPMGMSDGEVQHQHWTHQQLGEQRKAIISQWSSHHEVVFEGVKTIFVHYGLAGSSNDLLRVVHNPKAIDLDKMFAEYRANLVFFGHDHASSDVTGKARYINPGSLGCCSQAIARYIIATFVNHQVSLQHCNVPYDDQKLYQAFEARKVPERDFLYKVFFGGRFGA